MDTLAKLSVIDLDLYYGDTRALRNISLDMRSKTVTAFIGPSGCGKSTLLRCLNRMNDFIPSCRIKGKVLLDGESLYEDKVDCIGLRRRIGMVFQRPNPFPTSIWDNLVYGPKLHGIKDKDALREIAEESLKRAAIWMRWRISSPLPPSPSRGGSSSASVSLGP